MVSSEPIVVWFLVAIVYCAVAIRPVEYSEFTQWNSSVSFIGTDAGPHNFRLVNVADYGGGYASIAVNWRNGQLSVPYFEHVTETLMHRMKEMAQWTDEAWKGMVVFYSLFPRVTINVVGFLSSDASSTMLIDCSSAAGREQQAVIILTTNSNSVYIVTANSCYERKADESQTVGLMMFSMNISSAALLRSTRPLAYSSITDQYYVSNAHGGVATHNGQYAILALPLTSLDGLKQGWAIVLLCDQVRQGVAFLEVPGVDVVSVFGLSLANNTVQVAFEHSGDTVTVSEWNNTTRTARVELHGVSSLLSFSLQHGSHRVQSFGGINRRISPMVSLATNSATWFGEVNSSTLTVQAGIFPASDAGEDQSWTPIVRATALHGSSGDMLGVCGIGKMVSYQPDQSLWAIGWFPPTTKYTVVFSDRTPMLVNTTKQSWFLFGYDVSTDEVLGLVVGWDEMKGSALAISDSSVTAGVVSGNKIQLVSLNLCTSDCSLRGAFCSWRNGSGVCNCQSPSNWGSFGGDEPHCSLEYCQDKGSCGETGTCNLSTGRCECSAGWAPPHCQRQLQIESQVVFGQDMSLPTIDEVPSTEVVMNGCVDATGNHVIVGLSVSDGNETIAFARFISPNGAVMWTAYIQHQETNAIECNAVTGLVTVVFRMHISSSRFSRVTVLSQSPSGNKELLDDVVLPSTAEWSVGVVQLSASGIPLGVFVPPVCIGSSECRQASGSGSGMAVSSLLIFLPVLYTERGIQYSSIFVFDKVYDTWKELRVFSSPIMDNIHSSGVLAVCACSQSARVLFVAGASASSQSSILSNEDSFSFYDHGGSRMFVAAYDVYTGQLLDFIVDSSEGEIVNSLATTLLCVDQRSRWSDLFVGYQLQTYDSSINSGHEEAGIMRSSFGFAGMSFVSGDLTSLKGVSLRSSASGEHREEQFLGADRRFVVSMSMSDEFHMFALVRFYGDMNVHSEEWTDQEMRARSVVQGMTFWLFSLQLQSVITIEWFSEISSLARPVLACSAVSRTGSLVLTSADGRRSFRGLQCETLNFCSFRGRCLLRQEVLTNSFYNHCDCEVPSASKSCDESPVQFLGDGSSYQLSIPFNLDHAGGLMTGIRISDIVADYNRRKLYISGFFDGLAPVLWGHRSLGCGFVAAFPLDWLGHPISTSLPLWVLLGTGEGDSQTWMNEMLCSEMGELYVSGFAEGPSHHLLGQDGDHEISLNISQSIPFAATIVDGRWSSLTLLTDDDCYGSNCFATINSKSSPCITSSHTLLFAERGMVLGGTVKSQAMVAMFKVPARNSSLDWKISASGANFSCITGLVGGVDGTILIDGLWAGGRFSLENAMTNHSQSLASNNIHETKGWRAQLLLDGTISSLRSLSENKEYGTVLPMASVGQIAHPGVAYQPWTLYCETQRSESGNGTHCYTLTSGTSSVGADVWFSTHNRFSCNSLAVNAGDDVLATCNSFSTPSLQSPLTVPPLQLAGVYSSFAALWTNSSELLFVKSSYSGHVVVSSSKRDRNGNIFIAVTAYRSAMLSPHHSILEADGIAYVVVYQGCDNKCGAHGRCNWKTNLCMCDDGWEGHECNVARCPSDPLPCHGHGYCVVPDICRCHLGYAPPTCAECAEGFQYPSCTTCQRGRNPPDCQSCKDGFLEPDCLECIDGFTGPNCDVCAHGRDPATHCRGCLPHFQEPSCNECKLGYQMPSCNECIPGFDPLDDCSSCMPGHDPATNCQSCLPYFDSFNGCNRCVRGRTGPTCQDCADGFAPPTCDECLPGFLGRECRNTCPLANYQPPECESCLIGYSGADCMCQHGYSGPDCANFTCTPLCATNGVCISPDQCYCLNGFSGQLCNVAPSASSMQAFMVGNGEYHAQDSVSLDASSSTDISHPRASLSFEWRCLDFTNTSVPCGIDLTDRSVLNISPGLLRDGHRYIFSVDVQNEESDMQATASGWVNITAQTAPTVNILQSPHNPVAFGTDISISASVIPSSNTAIARWMWQFTGEDGEIVPIEDWDIAYNSFSSSITVPGGFLVGHVAVVVRAVASDGLQTEADFTLHILPPQAPPNADCRISSLSGTALATRFQLHCFGFDSVPGHGTWLYQWSYQSDDGLDVYLNTPQHESTLYGRLPKGSIRMTAHITNNETRAGITKTEVLTVSDYAPLSSRQLDILWNDLSSIDPLFRLSILNVMAPYAGSGGLLSASEVFDRVCALMPVMSFGHVANVRVELNSFSFGGLCTAFRGVISNGDFPVERIYNLLHQIQILSSALQLPGNMHIPAQQSLTESLSTCIDLARGIQSRHKLLYSIRQIMILLQVSLARSILCTDYPVDVVTDNISYRISGGLKADLSDSLLTEPRGHVTFRLPHALVDKVATDEDGCVWWVVGSMSGRSFPAHHRGLCSSFVGQIGNIPVWLGRVVSFLPSLFSFQSTTGVFSANKNSFQVLADEGNSWTVKLTYPHTCSYPHIDPVCQNFGNEDAWVSPSDCHYEPMSGLESGLGICLCHRLHVFTQLAIPSSSVGTFSATSYDGEGRPQSQLPATRSSFLSSLELDDTQLLLFSGFGAAVMVCSLAVCCLCALICVAAVILSSQRDRYAHGESSGYHTVRELEEVAIRTLHHENKQEDCLDDEEGAVDEPAEIRMAQQLRDHVSFFRRDPTTYTCSGSQRSQTPGPLIHTDSLRHTGYQRSQDNSRGASLFEEVEEEDWRAAMDELE